MIHLGQGESKYLQERENNIFFKRKRKKKSLRMTMTSSLLRIIYGTIFQKTKNYLLLAVETKLVPLIRSNICIQTI